MGGGAGGGGTTAPAPTQAVAGGNKGSSASQAGTGNTQSVQEMLQQMKQDRTSDLIRQGFQQAGAAVGQQQPYMQQGQGQGGLLSQAFQSPTPGAQTGPNLAATGPLFSGPGISSGGIDEQQLAAILRQLGYG